MTCRLHLKMAFPASVNGIQLTRHKAGQSKPRRRLRPGEDILPDPNEPSSALGVGGPVLDFGRLGGARLEKDVRKGRSQWGWSWILEERSGEWKVLVTDDS